MAVPVAAWYDPDSSFRRELELLLGESTQIEVFEWSGANSLGSRKDASEALTKHLVRAKARWPRRRHFVVAHSHGGNIALEAVRTEPVSGLVTMATPFLHTEPITTSLVEGWLLDRALVAIMRLPLVLATLLVLWYRITQEPSSEPSNAVGFILLAIALGFVLSESLPQMMFQARHRLSLTTFESPGFIEVPELLRKPDRDKTKPAPLTSPLLVIRADGDEASKALAVARSAAEAAGVLWRLVRLLGRIVSPTVARIGLLPESIRLSAALVWYLLIVLLFGIGFLERQWSYLITAMVMGGLGLAIGYIVAPFLVATATLYALAFGLDMLFVVYFVKIQATEIPSYSTGEIVRVSGDLLPSGQRRHSLHSVPAVRAIVASWIRDGHLRRLDIPMNVASFGGVESR
jgi:hypothetical protein